jgi:hypothetical protein
MQNTHLTFVNVWTCINQPEINNTGMHSIYTEVIFIFLFVSNNEVALSMCINT